MQVDRCRFRAVWPLFSRLLLVVEWRGMWCGCRVSGWQVGWCGCDPESRSCYPATDPNCSTRFRETLLFHEKTWNMFHGSNVPRKCSTLINCSTHLFHEKAWNIPGSWSPAHLFPVTCSTASPYKANYLIYPMGVWFTAFGSFCYFFTLLTHPHPNQTSIPRAFCKPKSQLHLNSTTYSCFTHAMLTPSRQLISINLSSQQRSASIVAT